MSRGSRIRSLASVVILGGAFATTGVGCTGCPAALLAGQLLEQGDELVIAVSESGPAEHIIWPFGYGLRSDGGHVVLTDVLGGVKARAGDAVRLGGGETKSGTFKVCGLLEIDPT